MQSFVPRKTWLVGRRSIQGRRFKVYSICAATKDYDESVVTAAIHYATEHIQWPEQDSGHGFLTVHFGDSIWLLIDVWKQDILCHYLFHSDYIAPKQFEPGPDDGTTACVWELEAIQHERNAWVQHTVYANRIRYWPYE